MVHRGEAEEDDLSRRPFSRAGLGGYGCFWTGESRQNYPLGTRHMFKYSWKNIFIRTIVGILEIREYNDHEAVGLRPRSVNVRCKKF